MKFEICKNCKHFTRHYVHTRFMGFQPVDCGHCHLRAMRKTNCENFEDGNNIDEQNISIINSFLMYELKLKKLQETLNLLLTNTSKLKNEILNLEKKHE